MPKLLGVCVALQLVLNVHRRICASSVVLMCAGMPLQCL
jgi:hypothetical protein